MVNYDSKGRRPLTLTRARLPGLLALHEGNGDSAGPAEG